MIWDYTASIKFLYPVTSPKQSLPPRTKSYINNTFLLISPFTADEGQALLQGHSGGSILKFNRSHTQI